MQDLVLEMSGALVSSGDGPKGPWAQWGLHTSPVQYFWRLLRRLIYWTWRGAGAELGSRWIRAGGERWRPAEYNFPGWVHLSSILLILEWKSSSDSILVFRQRASQHLRCTWGEADIRAYSGGLVSSFGTLGTIVYCSSLGHGVICAGKLICLKLLECLDGGLFENCLSVRCERQERVLCCRS